MDVIILNGTGSSGKTSIAKQLQEKLSNQYLNFSIDSVLYALPPSDLQKMMQGLPIKRDGYDYAQLTQGYHNSIKGLLKAGCRLIIDSAWIDKQEIDNLNKVLEPFSVLRVGVKCRLSVCEEREKNRGDRAIGLAKSEFPVVHQYMNYDLIVDTTENSPNRAAKEVINHLNKMSEA